MLLGKTPRRIVAATLLTILTTDIFVPGICYAITSGPTQPEAMSFEPIDTTDMVNLQTGDFTYNYPLLEVPGPDGGYPLALSYHAGVHTNDDATWVGLGWSLNPGAINRTVNGLPDDWRGLATGTETYWAGDQVNNYGVGVTIGQAGGADNVSFGLSVQTDTYKGFSFGYSVSAGPFSFGEKPFSRTGPSLSMGLPVPGMSLGDMDKYGFSASMGLNLTTNFKSFTVGINESVKFEGGSAEGSISSDGKSSSSAMFSDHGTTFFLHNGKSNLLQTSSWGIQNFPVPILPYLTVNLSFSKKRSWINSSTDLTAAGSWFQTYPFPVNQNNVFDNYALLDDPSTYNIYEYPDPSIMMGGGLPDFDNYAVTAQGMSGNFRPYYYQGQLNGQERLGSSNDVSMQYFSHGVVGGPTGFRFNGDFSNAFLQNPAAPNFYTTANMGSFFSSTTVPPFDPAPLFGSTSATGGYAAGTLTSNYGANISAGAASVVSLAGSRHIDLGVKVNPYNCPTNSTGRYATGMFSGFAITNESGVTYNYGLPAYSYNEENYQEKIDHSQGLFFNRNAKKNAYIYTWYLTSITGADYVDRNNDGKADAGDWGYWVNFEYGEWSDSYTWRNPAASFDRDEDNRFKDCSMGQREVYYLNAIRTASHIALFEKDVRNDAKGEDVAIFNKNGNPAIQDYAYADTVGVFDVNSSQSLQLSHIYLLPIAAANLVTTTTGPGAYAPSGRTQACNCELSSNVLDRTDVDYAGRTNLESNSLRVIDFNYDYSLCPNTQNSFALTPGTSNVGPLTGKLTLKAVTVRGKGGVSGLPALQFGYELPTDQQRTAAGTVSPSTFTTSYSGFQVGDMLQANGIYYGVVTGPYNSSTQSYPLGNSSMTGSPISATLTTTSNPPYFYNAYDMWGMYKSDYDLWTIGSDENLGRNTSNVSAPGADAWSLHTITTQLGDQIELNYQPDSYHTVAMGNIPSLVMKNITVVAGSSNGKIQFNLANFGSLTNPASIIQNGSVFSAVQLLVDATYSGCNGCYWKIAPPTTSLTINSVTGTGASATYVGTLGAPITTGGFTGTIWTGNLYINQGSDYYGGGIRVGSLALKHTFDNTVSTVTYAYNTPGSGYSSGTTSYLPVVLDAYDATQVNYIPPGKTYETLNGDGDLYQKALYKTVSGLYPLVRELPSPGVMYQYVTETDQYTNADEPTPRTIPGTAQYQFDVFTPNMVGREPVDPTNPILVDGVVSARNWVLRSFVGNVGNLRSVTQYDAQGNVLTQTVNHYLHDGIATLDFHDFMTQYYPLLLQFNYQGLIKERYSEIKQVNFDDPSNQGSINLGGKDQEGSKATMLDREQYPCILTGQTITDYVKGETTTTKNLAYDFYSGSVSEKLETDPYGNNFMTKTVPAYQIYPSMGVKINTDANLNMLAQNAETYRYKVDANNNPLGLVTASVTTWSNGFSAMAPDGTQHIQDGRTEQVSGATVPNGNIWRQQSVYDWMSPTQTSDGLTPTSSFVDFNWTTPASSDSRWVNNSTNTLYDIYSKSLENTDVNGNYSAAHMNYGENKVILAGGPANYYEIAYSGAEDAAINNPSTSFIKAQAGTMTTAAAHTGASSLLMNPGSSTAFLYTVPIVASGNGGVIAGRNYTASVWVKPVSGTASNVHIYFQINGATMGSSISSGSSTKTAGSWTLVNLSIPGSMLSAGSTLAVFCENDHATAQAYADDFRFQPLNASTTAYVYDPFSGELTYTLDNNDLYTQFQYDAAGQLVDIYKEKLGVTPFKTNQYQYNYSASKFGNDPITNINYTRNTCPVGYQGSSVSVNIPANTYYSFLSTADADARTAIYAQDYANTHGTCTCLPVINWASGITPVLDELSISGGNVPFTFVFTYPSGQTSFNLGTVSNCVFPAIQQTIPMTINSSVYDIIVSTLGLVTVQWVSGPVLSGTVGLTGTYSLNGTLAYSAAESGTFQKSCPSGQVGSYVTYSVPAYKYASDNQTDANNLALADVASNGPNYANANGTCSIVCSFTFSSNWPNNYTGRITITGTTASYNFVFAPTSNLYSGGGSSTLGTISGGCDPSSSATYSVTDAIFGSTWNVTIYTSGQVTVQCTGVGPRGTNGYIPAGQMISLSGTYIVP